MPAVAAAAPDETPKPEKANRAYRDSRLGPASKARNLFQMALQADSLASINRKRVFDQVTGAPPYDEDLLRELDRASEVNLNMGGAEAKIDAADSQYIDLLLGVETIANVHTTWGQGPDRIRAQQIIDEELHQLYMVDQEDFVFTQLRLFKERDTYGVGICYFPSRLDFRWDSAGLSSFIVQRGSEARGTDFDIAFQRSRKTIPQLLQMLNPESKNIGWDEAALKRVILNTASPQIPAATQGGASGHVWEDFAKSIKNNDLWYSASSNAPRVDLITAWVREYDGKLSQFIFHPEEGGYLYQGVGVYKKTTDGFVIFVSEVGSGDFHSVRGLGYRLEPMETSRNRLFSKLLTSAGDSVGNLWQAKTNEAVNDFEMIEIGANSIIGPGFDFVQRPQNDFAEQLLAVVQALDVESTNNTGSYRQRDEPGRQGRTAFEVRAEVAHGTVLSSARVSLFYQDFARLLNASMRRLQNKGLRLQDPGGDLVHAFWQRLIDRGVPLEALWQVKYVTPAKALGSGNPSMQRVLAQDLIAFLPYLDEAGQEVAKRISAASIVGWSNVDALVPKQKQMRASIDIQFAELENTLMMNGTTVQVLPGQNNFEHALAHERAITVLLDSFAKEQIAPAPAATVLAVLIPHQKQHVEPLLIDPAHREVGKQFARNIRAADDMFNRVSQMATAQAEAQQKKALEMQQQGGNGAQPQGPSAKEQAMLAETQAKIETMRAESASKIALDHAETVAKMRQKDLEGAGKLASKMQESSAPGDALAAQRAVGTASIQHDGAAPPGN